MMSLEWDIDLDLAKKLDCTEYHLGVTGEEKVLSSWFNGLAKTNIYPQRLLRSDRGKGRESDLSCWFSIYSLDKLRCLSAHTHTHTQDRSSAGVNYCRSIDLARLTVNHSICFPPVF